MESQEREIYWPSGKEVHLSGDKVVRCNYRRRKALKTPGTKVRGVSKKRKQQYELGAQDHLQKSRAGILYALEQTPCDSAVILGLGADTETYAAEVGERVNQMTCLEFDGKLGTHSFRQLPNAVREKSRIVIEDLSGVYHRVQKYCDETDDLPLSEFADGLLALLTEILALGFDMHQDPNLIHDGPADFVCSSCVLSQLELFPIHYMNVALQAKIDPDGVTPEEAEKIEAIHSAQDLLRHRIQIAHLKLLHRLTHSKSRIYFAFTPYSSETSTHSGQIRREMIPMLGEADRFRVLGTLATQFKPLAKSSWEWVEDIPTNGDPILSFHVQSQILRHRAGIREKLEGWYFRKRLKMEPW